MVFRVDGSVYRLDRQSHALQPLARRTSPSSAAEPSWPLSEKRMFGGIAFLLYGNVLAGVWQSSLVVRPGPEQAASALKRDHVRRFDVTGRPMKGWIMVDPDGLDSDRELSDSIGAAATSWRRCRRSEGDLVNQRSPHGSVPPLEFLEQYP